jgi:hypothetical protein
LTTIGLSKIEYIDAWATILTIDHHSFKCARANSKCNGNRMMGKRAKDPAASVVGDGPRNNLGEQIEWVRKVRGVCALVRGREVDCGRCD